MSGPLLSRRRLLRSAGAATAVGAGVLTGCDSDFFTSPAPPRTSHVGPDERVLLAARAELVSLIRHVSATPGQTALRACHRIQLEALGGTVPVTARRAHPLTSAQLQTRERRAAARFMHWATTCRSGDLARALAAVAAGIEMQPVLRGAT